MIQKLENVIELKYHLRTAQPKQRPVPVQAGMTHAAAAARIGLPLRLLQLASYTGAVD